MFCFVSCLGLKPEWNLKTYIRSIHSTYNKISYNFILFFYGHIQFSTGEKMKSTCGANPKDFGFEHCMDCAHRGML